MEFRPLQTGLQNSTKLLIMIVGWPVPSTSDLFPFAKHNKSLSSPILDKISGKVSKVEVLSLLQNKKYKDFKRCLSMAKLPVLIGDVAG